MFDLCLIQFPRHLNEDDPVRVERKISRHKFVMSKQNMGSPRQFLLIIHAISLYNLQISLPDCLVRATGVLVQNVAHPGTIATATWNNASRSQSPSAFLPYISCFVLLTLHFPPRISYFLFVTLYLLPCIFCIFVGLVFVTLYFLPCISCAHSPCASVPCASSPACPPKETCPTCKSFVLFSSRTSILLFWIWIRVGEQAAGIRTILSDLSGSATHRL